MPEDSHAQRRAYYRLRYPEAERPMVEVGDNTYPVVELSEAGVRVHVGATAPARPGTPFSGFIRFRDDDVVPVRGDWFRFEGTEAVVRLSAGVSMRRMLDEQRRLIHLYPTDDGEGDDPSPAPS